MLTRLVLIVTFFVSALAWPQDAVIPIVIGPPNRVIAPAVDGAGGLVVFGSAITPDGTASATVDIYAVAQDGTGLRRLTRLAGSERPPEGATAVSLPPGAFQQQLRQPLAILPCPAPHGLPDHLHPPCRLGLTQSLLQQTNGFKAALFQRRKVPSHSCWVSHARLDAPGPQKVSLYYAGVNRFSNWGHRPALYCSLTLAQCL